MFELLQYQESSLDISIALLKIVVAPGPPAAPADHEKDEEEEGG